MGFHRHDRILARIVDRLLAVVPQQRIDQVVAHVPVFVAALLVRLLASPREIGPLPRWDFALNYLSDEMTGSPSTQLRRSLWEYFNRRGADTSVSLAWVSNLTLIAYPGNDTTWPLFVGGCIEPNEMSLLASALSLGMTFVDVGANEGLFALLAAKCVGASGVVVAIDPSPREYERLRANIRKNRLKNVLTVQAALANSEGIGELSVADARHGGHNTLGSFAYADVKSECSASVRLTTLDRLVDELSVGGVDAIKIDVEGAELAVLEGAEETVRRFRPLLVFEVLDPALRSQGASGEALVTHVLERGYRLFRFDEHTGMPTPMTVMPDESCNLVATHPDRPWEQIDELY